MSNIKAKFLSILLIACLVLIPCLHYDVFAQSLHEDIYLEKINFHDTKEDLNITTNSQLKTITKNFTEQLTDESYIMLQFNSDYKESEEYKSLLNQRESITTDQERNEFRENVKNISKEYHKKIVDEKISTLDLPRNVEIEQIDYSPFVRVKATGEMMNPSIISRLAKSNEVKNLDIALNDPTPIDEESICPRCGILHVAEDSEVPDDEMSFNTALDVIGAKSIVNNSSYTGNGIKVGIYESGGIPDRNHTNLQGKNIIVRDSSCETTDHATNVASIIFAIAPNVTLYASNVNTIGVSWFIDNNVDVVNCSFGYYNNTLNDDGTYTNGEKKYRNDIDGVYDYQIQTNFMHVVKSAGNYNNNNSSSSYNPDNRVSSPGHAKNVITVGGTTRSFMFNCDVIGYVNKHEPNASFTTIESVNKPNISAPYTIDIPNIGTRSGTSYAAPQVTGILALLFQAQNYALWPEKTHAAISVTASEIYGQTRNYVNFDNRVGAGIINLNNLLNIKGTATKSVEFTQSSQSEIYSRTITINKNYVLKATLFWLVRFEMNTLYCTDYDLYLYDSNNNRVANSSTGSNNTEMIVYKAPANGSYRLVVYQYGAFRGSSGTDWTALAYNY